MRAYSRRRLVVPLVVAACAIGERGDRLGAQPSSGGAALLDGAAAGAAPLAARPAIPAASYVRGSVVDDLTGSPIVGARVTIRDTRFSTITNVEGRFYFEDVPRGNYVLHVAHIAYVQVPASLRIASDAVDVVVRLDAAVIPLEPIRVTAFSRRLDEVGFYDRQRRGVGTFIGRSQVDGMRALNSSDLMRVVPSARLTPQPPSRTQGGMALAGRGRCRFSFIVDGARTLPDFEMDMVAPYAIEGLEFYRSLAELPAPFRVHVGREGNATSCGIVLIWTRNRI
jgi:hypothetical protein